jgi:hypothetical protein
LNKNCNAFTVSKGKRHVKYIHQKQVYGLPASSWVLNGITGNKRRNDVALLRSDQTNQYVAS